MSQDLARGLADKIKDHQRLIVVVGDALVDAWHRGHVEPSQDGCPKFVTDERWETAGGAALAAACLEQWPIRVELYSRLVGRKTRLLVGDTIVYRVDEDEPKYLTDWSRLLLKETIPYASAVLMSDYDKGVLSPDLIRMIVDESARAGIPCVADAKREPSFYAGAIIKGNLAWRRSYDIEELPARYVITQGADPPYGYDCDHAFSLNPEPDVPCINHVGAGDCFAAHLTLALAYGYSLKDGAALAHAAGRRYVGLPPGSTPCGLAAGAIRAGLA